MLSSYVTIPFRLQHIHCLYLTAHYNIGRWYKPDTLSWLGYYSYTCASKWTTTAYTAVKCPSLSFSEGLIHFDARPGFFRTFHSFQKRQMYNLFKRQNSMHWRTSRTTLLDRLMSITLTSCIKNQSFSIPMAPAFWTRQLHSSFQVEHSA